MIVVDTNVISELMRGEPHPAVLAWVAAQPRALLYTTHINQAEILYGIGALPEGRRRTALALGLRLLLFLQRIYKHVISPRRSLRRFRGAL